MDSKKPILIIGPGPRHNPLLAMLGLAMARKLPLAFTQLSAVQKEFPKPLSPILRLYNNSQESTPSFTILVPKLTLFNIKSDALFKKGYFPPPVIASLLKKP